ncbi:transposase [Streptomyces lavendofoliae]|uniref:transposase n=1 Tax=Streptomyces lavendofoliae TaxID=67314 RepID=UPI0035716C28
MSVDSTICRAHQHAAGVRRDGQSQKEPPGGHQAEPDDHGLGRSRGGWTTKIHLACEQGHRPLSLLVTAGQRGDSPQFTAVLEAIRVPRLGLGRPRVRPTRVWGDKAYSSRANRAYLRRRGIRCTDRSLPIRSATANAGGRAAGGQQGRCPLPYRIRQLTPTHHKINYQTGPSGHPSAWPSGATRDGEGRRPRSRRRRR